ncbi:hypothetical protein FQZ97_1220000 [compost metagenome]
MVAGFLQGIERKLLVDQLDPEQAEGIDGVGGQPVQHLGQANGQGVDVPGGEFHGGSLRVKGAWRALSLPGGRCPGLTRIE